jgi:hypothetical protein
MEEDAHFERGRSQVADQLHSISPRQFFRRFVFDDHAVVDDHVEALSGDMPALVMDVDHQLANDDVAPVAELTCERTGINALAQAVPLVVVYGKEAADDGMDAVGLE